MREHSPLGASAAERYINCPGSIRLAEKIQPPNIEPEYTRHGIAAHKLVAFALSNYHEVWEVLEQDWGCEFSLLEVQAMQDFVDLVRRRIEVFKQAFGEVTIFVEYPMHRPELHELFYGTLDVGIVAGDEAEIIDYKHGAGIAVDAVGNPQLRMYAIGFILDLPEVRRVRLRISQPRAFHPDGPDRSDELEVPDLMRWFDTVLFPAMEAADPRSPWPESKVLNPGEWCRFCPCKRQCPAIAKQLVNVDRYAPGANYSNEELGTLYSYLPTVKMKIAAIEAEVHARNIRDPTKLVPGSKLVAAKAIRQWKDGAEDALAVLGPERYTMPALKSPSQLENEFGARAKRLTKIWAEAPDNGYTTAPISDRRKAVSLNKPVDNYQAYLGAKP
jgi:hypothetical protein